jgi:Zn-dependent protease with chaperone function
VFMNNIFSALGPEASFGIIAHEFGHHIDLNSTPPWMNNSWSRELRADAWAGCALARRGFGPAQLSLSLQAISQYPSPSHPAWNMRVPAIQQGFVACGGNPSVLPWR